MYQEYCNCCQYDCCQQSNYGVIRCKALDKIMDVVEAVFDYMEDDIYDE